MTVDTNTGKLRLSIAESSLEGIKAEVAEYTQWFNLQGIPVENPSNGLYIRVSNGKSKVEIVK
ncbi:MAG: hypothetical protein ACI4AK_08470 [Lepagella sp.]